MPRNIELKARAPRGLPFYEEVAKRLLAATVSNESVRQHARDVIHQKDIFFKNTASGTRLKLRHIRNAEEVQLIEYSRDDGTESRGSDFKITRVPKSQQDTMLEILWNQLGASGVVEKRRVLYLIGQTRVHIDEVVDLGLFIEFEVVMREGQDDAEGHAIIAELRREFEINDDDLVAYAYVDLLEKKRNEVPPLKGHFSSLGPAHPTDTLVYGEDGETVVAIIKSVKQCMIPKRKVYVAGAWHRKPQVKALMQVIEEKCWSTVTHDWTQIEDRIYEDDEKELARSRECAALDVQGVRDANFVVVLMDQEEYSYRGSFCELGVALGSEKPVYVLCDKDWRSMKAAEVVFFHHPNVIHVQSQVELLIKLGATTTA